MKINLTYEKWLETNLSDMVTYGVSVLATWERNPLELEPNSPSSAGVSNSMFSIGHFCPDLLK